MTPEQAGSSAAKRGTDPLTDESDDWFLRDAIFDRVGEVYTDDIIDIVRNWLDTYERSGCSLGDAQQELATDE